MSGLGARPERSAEQRRRLNDRPAIRVRGIYATSVTRILLDLGYPIAEPSSVIASRLRLHASSQPARVSIDDRIDRQGIRLRGGADDIVQVSEALVRAIPGTVWVSGPLAMTVVFCRSAKSFLDEQRRRVIPTLADHHLLKANDVPGVDSAEARLGFDLAEATTVGHQLWQSALFDRLVPGARIKIVHAKPWKRDVIAPSTVESFVDGLLTVRRDFRGGGTYDSLGEPKCDGDWGRIEILSGASILRRTYYRATGELIGELFNIQSPTEIGPSQVWYIDLEVDVVRTASGRVALVDLEELRDLAQSNAIARSITDRARSLADELAGTLIAGGNWLSVASLAPAG